MNNSKLSEFKELGGYDVNGSWYPRVTKIVEIKAKPALYKFYGELSSFNEGEKIKERSASEGTLIHETIEALMIGEAPAISPTVLPAVEAYLEFSQKIHIHVDPEYVEKRLVNYGERYAGTLDAIALINGKLGVLDIKTSQSIYRDYNLQTSAYMAALEKDIPQLQTRWILRIDQHQICSRCGAILRSKGGRDKIRLPWQYAKKAIAEKCVHEWSPTQGDVEMQEFPYWKTDYKAFLGAKRLWEWEHEDVLKEIGYL